MPDRLVSYVQERFQEERAPIDTITALTDEVIGVLLEAFDDETQTWPYQLTSEKASDPQQRDAENSEFSFSTTAMIAYALELASGAIDRSSLAPAVTRYQSLDADELLKRRSKTKDVVDRAIDKLAVESAKLAEASTLSDLLKRGRPEPHPRPPYTASSTFGWDDPFTLNWLADVLSVPHRQTNPLLARVSQRATNLTNSVLKVPYEPDESKKDHAPQPRRILQLKPDEAVEHAFPLLGVLHLQQTLRSSTKDGLGDLAAVREYLLDLVHRQLSESQVKDGNFDSAELVFALEGWLITADTEPSLAIVDRVFDVMTEQNEQSPYWRPVKPFKATPQGLVLLPQSVEIANSLLRICAAPALGPYRYFGRHLPLLSSYTDWVRRRVFRGSPPSGTRMPELVGWESEFSNRLDRIHLWETSQVLIYLQHYGAMFREHLAYKLLDVAGLRPEVIQSKDGPQEDWVEFRNGDPMLGTDVTPNSPYLVYQDIERHFIVPRQTDPPGDAWYSMLLYGPPGTGKSTIAKKLAGRLTFRFLTITPSDFITSGAEEIEARSKAIFTALGEQTNLVVLFDEIDSLLLDRNTPLYREQGDVFRLLTPGMLTKLNDLAKRRSVLFVIATNYFERIDAAIKRPGRIDARYLVLPPSARQRAQFLQSAKQLGESRWVGLPNEGRDVINASVRFTYAELEQVVKRIKTIASEASGSVLMDELTAAIRDAPPIAVESSYHLRFEKEKAHGPTIAGAADAPWEEYALLAFLDIDAKRALSADVRNYLRESLNKEVVKDDRVRLALLEASATAAPPAASPATGGQDDHSAAAPPAPSAATGGQDDHPAAAPPAAGPPEVIAQD